jgi:hypothetical protein
MPPPPETLEERVERLEYLTRQLLVVLAGVLVTLRRDTAAPADKVLALKEALERNDTPAAFAVLDDLLADAGDPAIQSE